MYLLLTHYFHTEKLIVDFLSGSNSAQMVEAKKNERANALKEVKRLCKEFGFTAVMLKGSLAEGRKKQ